MSYSSSLPVERIPLRVVIPKTSRLSGLMFVSPPTANRAYYVPFSIPHNGAISAISVFIASTTGNHDIGLYSNDGTQIGSKGSSSSSANVLNTWTPTTPININGGVQYFAAFADSSSSPSIGCYAGDIQNVTYGHMYQDSAFPLPATASFSAGAGILVPIMAIDLIF